MKEFVEKPIEKIKVTSLEIIVTGTKDKPYFEIKYKVVGKEDYNIGYSSYDLNNVLNWKEECFEIVNQLAEEYGKDTNVITNNGWIPCSEKLPDDFMSMAYLTTVKGHFYPEVKYYCVANHKWYSNERTTKEVKVIAWMPLPVAYQKGE